MNWLIVFLLEAVAIVLLLLGVRALVNLIERRHEEREREQAVESGRDQETEGKEGVEPVTKEAHFCRASAFRFVADGHESYDLGRDIYAVFDQAWLVFGELYTKWGNTWLFRVERKDGDAWTPYFNVRFSTYGRPDDAKPELVTLPEDGETGIVSEETAKQCGETYRLDVKYSHVPAFRRTFRSGRRDLRPLLNAMYANFVSVLNRGTDNRVEYVFSLMPQGRAELLVEMTVRAESATLREADRADYSRFHKALKSTEKDPHPAAKRSGAERTCR